MREAVITSSVLIVIISALRYLLRGRISPRLQYALWGLVLLRLMLPFSLVQSPVSVMNVLPEAAPVYDAPPPVVNVDAYVPELQPGGVEVQAPQPAVSQPTPVDWALTARYVWIGGAAAMGLWMALCNLRFYAKLRKTRRMFEDTICEGVRVYVADGLPSPCLYGLFRPCIYLTPESVGDGERLRHILTHELTHMRHMDNLWSVLRGLCLCVYWFDPLVWLAAALSRRDCELACDESAIKRLGEEVRLEYGRTLVNMLSAKRDPATLLRAATTMTGGKRSLKERVSLIAKKPKMAAYTLAAVLIVAAIAAGCTFTGATAERPPETPPPTSDPGDIAETPEPTPEPQVFAVTSGGETAEPFLDMLYEQTWTEHGWLNGDGFPMNAERLAELWDELPELKMGRDFRISFPDGGGMNGRLKVYDRDFNLVSDDWNYGSTAVWWLGEGEYACIMPVFQRGDYIASEEEYESSGYRLMFRLTVDGSYGVVPFGPEDVRELTSAELSYSFGDFSITDAEGLAWLEDAFSKAETLLGGTACPFAVPMFLTRADGTVGAVCPAEDSCGIYYSDGAFYKYAGDNEELWERFGIETHSEKEEYDAEGRVIRRTKYTWYRPGAYTEYRYHDDGSLAAETRYSPAGLYKSEIRYLADGSVSGSSDCEYDEAGNMIIASVYKADGSLDNRDRMEYDDSGRQIKWEFYDGNDQLTGWLTNHWDENGVLSEVHSYDADGALLFRYETLYDESGELIKMVMYDAEGSVTGEADLSAFENLR